MPVTDGMGISSIFKWIVWLHLVLAEKTTLFNKQCLSLAFWWGGGKRCWHLCTCELWEGPSCSSALNLMPENERLRI